VSLLIRLVADPDAPAGCRVDRRGSHPGRGAHIHPREECIELASRRRALTRALRIPVGASADIEQVRDQILG